MTVKKILISGVRFVFFDGGIEMGFLAYNENGSLQEYESSSGIVKCSHCARAYRQTVMEQVPGFRERDNDVCPYCGELNGSSMEVEYTNSKI